jgi:hypothetical protein
VFGAPRPPNTGDFNSMESQFIDLIPDDDLPRMTKSLQMIYRDWPNHGVRQARISKDDLMKPAA